MQDKFDTVMSRLPFGNREPEGGPDPDKIIDRLESTLNDALERRQDIRRELRQELRKYRIARKQAEAEMGTSADEDIELTGHRVEGYEEVIDELRNRIKALNQQIVAIEKRIPTLQVLRTDVELMRRLQGEETVQDDVQELMKELNGESPREASADTQLQSLLQSIDSMASQGGTGVPASPTFPVIDELDNEVEEANPEQAVLRSDSDDLP